MRRVTIALCIALAPLALNACATASTVSEAPAAQGATRDFAANYDVVKAAALESVERMNVNVQGSDETPERFQIRFTKSISAFSWGEVGVVNVMRVDDANARVVVNSEKRSRMQVTGTSERQFSEQVFANIAESLARLNP